MSILINTRVYAQEGNTVYIGLAHFDTGSRIVFRCDHDGSRKDDPWGVSPLEILGTAHSYFGQYALLDKMSPADAAKHQAKNTNLVLDQFAKDNMSDSAVERINAFASALSVFLNLAGTGAQDANRPVPFDSVKTVMDDKVALLQPISPEDMEVSADVPSIVMSLTDITQREYTIHMAKLSPVFRYNIPKTYLEGQQAGEGMISDVLEYVGEMPPSH